ncbi:MAG: putative bifunctional diguanylate cyclase/phosphodiesterase [Terracidiphilus sp.]
MLVGSYDGWLVAASLIMAMLASYTALDMAGRVATADGPAARWWLSGGSLAMGIGIWSMHFLGTLAFRLPIAMGYDPWITIFSLVIATASSALALCMVCQDDLSWTRLSLGALLMGAGMSAMHYTGMASMRMTPEIQYDPFLFSLSVIVAILASGASLWIAFYLRRRSSHVRLLQAGAAVVMGLAIAGMHYTGMAAARFPAGSTCQMASSGFSAGWTALLIIVFGLAVLSIALIASLLDSRLESRTAILASSLADADLKLQFLAHHDSLTGLPNRAMLIDRLEQEIQKSTLDKSRFCVLFLDLDGFKEINDAFGHQAGDLLLAAVARRIRLCVRSSDTLARIGGDEFVLLANASEPADASTLAEKLVAAIRSPFAIAGAELRVTASIGIAIYNGAENEANELLKNADVAMHHAKSLGRNGFCFFERSMNGDSHEQQQILHDLRRAQFQQEMVLHYQPKVDAKLGKVIGVEALVRWNHPTRGMIAPDQFIPLAERTGLIVPLGGWVLNEACRQMSQWRASGHCDWTVSVNLSAVQFNHPGLIKLVREALQHHALDPHCLTLEITETTAMRDADASMVILQQLHEMGLRISIDDFGTGYSSLLYLKRLPASELKIDRGFVRDLPSDSEDAAIIVAIIALGRTLSLEIVAEGVETAEQQEFLTRLGCDSLQGFLLGRPVPAEQFILAASQSNAAARRNLLEMPGLMTA